MIRWIVSLILVGEAQGKDSDSESRLGASSQSLRSQPGVVCLRLFKSIHKALISTIVPGHTEKPVRHQNCALRMYSVLGCAARRFGHWEE